MSSWFYNHYRIVWTFLKYFLLNKFTTISKILSLQRWSPYHQQSVTPIPQLLCWSQQTLLKIVKIKFVTIFITTHCSPVFKRKKESKKLKQISNTNELLFDALENQANQKRIELNWKDCAAYNNVRFDNFSRFLVNFNKSNCEMVGKKSRLRGEVAISMPAKRYKGLKSVWVLSYRGW